MHYKYDQLKWSRKAKVKMLTFVIDLPLLLLMLNSHVSLSQDTPLKPSNSLPQRVSSLSCLAVCWTKRVLSQKR